MNIKLKLSFGFLLVFVLTTFVSILVYAQLQKMAKPLEEDIPQSIDQLSHSTNLDNLVHLIRYYDEILTQSVRIYAYSQEKKWEQRYFAFQPELDRVIKQAIAGSDIKDQDIFAKIAKANTLLIAMEYQALREVNNNNIQIALDLIASNEYRVQKLVYTNSLSEYFLRHRSGYEFSSEASTVMVRLAANNARQLLQDSLRETVILTLVILFILIAIGAVLTVTISKPLQKLTHYAVKLGEGDHFQTVSGFSNDEIGLLADAFQTMSDTIQKSHAQLEQRVAQRTLQLENKNQQLQATLVERAKLENQLLQSQKMESLGTLAGGIAHDFNNILASIMGNCELGLMRLVKGQEVESNFKAINLAGDRATALVKQILTFSRMDLGTPKVNDLSAIIHEDLEMISTMIPNNIEFRQNIQTHCMPILADRNQMCQVLMNLCSNAFQAIGNECNGEIEVSLKQKIDPHDISKKFPDGYLQLDVKDSGVGIELDIQRNIFDPFFTTKIQGQGTGLGLSVVHGIIDKHGGEIKIISETGVGTTFSVLLPTIKLATLEEQEMVLEVKNGTGTILVVEDEIEQAKIYQLYLEQKNYVVTVCHNGMDALSMFKENPNQFDLVLTDYSMPGMTGMQLITKILDIRSDIPVIICTGYGDTGKDKKLGVEKYLVKPIKLAKLQSTIEDCLLVDGGT